MESSNRPNRANFEQLSARSSSSNISNVYTPRTPRIHRQRFDLSVRPEEDDETDGLGGLVGQTWNIYAVSGLFGFQQDDARFKLYSKKLREEIANTLSREDVSYNAEFSVMEDIVSESNSEKHPAIQIEVIANDCKKEAEKRIYNGILLSWRITQTKPDMLKCTRLPLLLCRGTRNCIDAVHSVINRMFDCTITELSANEDDLNWLIPIIIMVYKEEQIYGVVQMEYVVPGLPITDTIVIKFATSELRKILTVIIEDENDGGISLDHEHIEMFREVLHKQMLTVGGLQLGLCTLHRISLPGITITNNRMKVTNIEIMDNILLYFNDKALDIFHTVQFIDTNEDTNLLNNCDT